MATNLPDVLDQPERFTGRRLSDQGPVRLRGYINAVNIATMLEAEQLGRIGARVVREYEIDVNSRKDWYDNNREAMDLALQVMESKSYPWPGAANVKFPILTTAAIQFAARAYPAIVRGPEVVKAQVIGKDEEGKKRARGDRVAAHMSWQLTQEMTEWEEETDKLLHVLPIAGMCYRKTYWSPELGRNCSELVLADKCVVNDNARSMARVPRITQEFELYPHEIDEREVAGTYRKIEYGPASEDDEDAPHTFLEQHRTLDLDEDGFREPYIVTVHKDTSQVVRIKANYWPEGIMYNAAGKIGRIERVEYFTKFGMLPNPSGKFHDIGFGYLLRPINEAINTTLNQLLDAGHLANTGGGFIGSGVSLRGGHWRFKPGEWKPVDVTGQALKDNMVALTFPGPSVVLFQLLGLLVEAAKDISSVKDIMTGQEPKSGNTPATTTLAMIEQGLQVFSAIYKRIFRSLKSEYAKLYDLNARYLNPDTYFTVLDTQQAIGPEDYKKGDFDIVPVADQGVITNMQKLARAQFLQGFAEDPHFDAMEIRRRLLEAAGIDDVDEILAKEPPKHPDAAKIVEAAGKMDLEHRKLKLEEAKAEAEMAERASKAILNLAQAEAAEVGQQIQAYQTVLDHLIQRAQMRMQEQDTGKDQGDGSGAVPDMASPSGNGAVPALPGGLEGAPQGPMGGGA